MAIDVVTHVIVISFTSAVPTVPELLATEQFCAGNVGCVPTATA